ncbi:MAG: MBL fold metallo-hydrolase [Deltaproteobacteria bacterium]|nr:MBL fold metallo-hydrolase [Deltaproteobacteria bacterium]
MNQITSNVYAETGYRGCNPGFVVTKEGVVIIDTPQLFGDAIAYRKEVKKHGKIVYLINTEPHGDHYIGNYFFDAIGIAQEGTRDVIMQVELEPLKERIKMMDPNAGPYLADYKIKPPTITFNKTMTIHLGNHTFQLFHLPGHTASETAVFVPEERIVFTGDNIFHETQVFLHEALPKEWLESLQFLKTLDADYFIPGHGEVCTVDYLDKMAAFVSDWITAVQDAVKQGWSLEEAQERISFLDRFPMGQGMEAFGAELQKMNVTRLYGLATNGQL